VSASDTKSSPASAAALRAVDDLLASVGLEHGRRRLTRQARYVPDREAVHELSRQIPQAVKKSELKIVRAPEWARFPWLLHGFSTRTGGVSRTFRPEQRAGELNLGFTPSDPKDAVLKNRRRFLAAIADDPEFPHVTLRQIHSGLTWKLTAKDDLAIERQGDGLMTDRPGLLLGIQTADCIPVMVADTRRKVVAIFHAGWRGTLKRIVEGGIGRMRMEFRSRPQDLVAAIGPGIGQCCYAVGDEVRTEFGSQFAYASELFCEVYDSDPIREKYPLLFLTARAPGHSPIGPGLHLDLMEANRRQLLDAGLQPEAITVIGDCTSCQNNLYFSYRAESGFTGRMLSVIGIQA
jgi:polyphenol oxidase